jgi:hypothetical protein
LFRNKQDAKNEFFSKEIENEIMNILNDVRRRFKQTKRLDLEQLLSVSIRKLYKVFLKKENGRLDTVKYHTHEIARLVGYFENLLTQIAQKGGIRNLSDFSEQNPFATNEDYFFAHRLLQVQDKVEKQFSKEPSMTEALKLFFTFLESLINDLNNYERLEVYANDYVERVKFLISGNREDMLQDCIKLFDTYENQIVDILTDRIIYLAKQNPDRYLSSIDYKKEVLTDEGPGPEDRIN